MKLHFVGHKLPNDLSQYVQENNLNYKSYPEVIAEYFIKENSIVIAGTFSKSTNAALMSWVLQKANYDPSYMFGGVGLDNMPTAQITDGKWSVIDGHQRLESLFRYMQPLLSGPRLSLLAYSVAYQVAAFQPLGKRTTQAHPGS